LWFLTILKREEREDLKRTKILQMMNSLHLGKLEQNLGNKVHLKILIKQEVLMLTNLALMEEILP